MTGPVSQQIPAHGILDWPFGADPGSLPRPAALPDGRPWPRIRLLLPAGAAHPDTAASIAKQGYPELSYGPRGPGGLPEDIADYVLILQDGDRLAPGALIALAFEAALSGADAVAGLRVLYEDCVLGLDVPSLSDIAPEREGFGAEILWSRRALEQFGDLDLATVWTKLPPESRSRIGRPVLLRRGRIARPEASLSIVSLTGTGTVGGAGVAHRRLSEALALAHHRIVEEVLSDRPAEAEWTDTFPATEARIAAAKPDLVLIGNVHGATRSLDIVGRLATAHRTALVLHDLFPLTGRCCHPRECTRAERGCDAACPTPDEYPQLAPRRIGEMHARKRAVLGAGDAPLLLANSSWTRVRSEKLAPAGAVTREIRLAFPTGVFRPGDKAALRRRLGLPETDVLILVSSVIVDGPDKGFADLREALRSVVRPGVGVVAIGRLDDPSTFGISPLFAPGLIASEEELASWYGACDLHLTASRHETLGQTPIEAGLCGVPTVAYRTSGLTSSVIDGVSGRLVPLEPGALAKALADMVADHAGRASLGAFARIAFESRFSPAAAALSLAPLLGRDSGRTSFDPAMLGHFPFAANRLRGAEGTVQAPSSALVGRLRRTKQAVLGRRMPLILRRCLYLASTLRRRVV